MKIIYDDSCKIHQCIFCMNWDHSCRFFKINISSNCDEYDGELHPAYRTLETFKCSVCDSCRKKGENILIDEIHAYMSEYIGAEHK